MKRLFLFVTMVAMSVAAMAGLMIPSIEIKDNLDGYEFFYVTPTTSMVSSGGITATSFFWGIDDDEVQTVVPSDVLIGSLMKSGYNVVTSILPESADKTLILTYGYVGKRRMDLFSHASEIIVNVQNAKTQKIVASIKAESFADTESECIRQALNSALMMLHYAMNPKIEYGILNAYKKSVYVELHNQTPNVVEKVKLRISYFDGETLIHQQEAVVNRTLVPDQQTKEYIKRDKIAQNKNSLIHVELIDYQ